MLIHMNCTKVLHLLQKTFWNLHFGLKKLIAEYSKMSPLISEILLLPCLVILCKGEVTSQSVIGFNFLEWIHVYGYVPLSHVNETTYMEQLLYQLA